MAARLLASTKCTLRGRTPTTARATHLLGIARSTFTVVIYGVLGSSFAQRVLGGVLAFGVIGAFLGPTFLAVGYRLLTEWTTTPAPQPEAVTGDNERGQ